MNIFEMIEKAKKSEFGATWYSDKGPIHISKEGNLTSIELRELPKYQPERSKREDHYIGGYFPPPWNPDEYPEKTKGWIAFQEEQRKDPKYYGCGALNIMET